MFPRELQGRLGRLTEARRDHAIERACIIYEADLFTWEEACELALNESAADKAARDEPKSGKAENA